MCGCLEDRPLVVCQDLEPGLEIRGVIRPRLELGGKAKISAEEATAELGDQLFARTLASVLAVSGEVASDAIAGCCPMDIMPISA
jgi:hypothetical protein